MFDTHSIYLNPHSCFLVTPRGTHAGRWGAPARSSALLPSRAPRLPGPGEQTRPTSSLPCATHWRFPPFSSHQPGLCRPRVPLGPTKQPAPLPPLPPSLSSQLPRQMSGNRVGCACRPPRASPPKAPLPLRASPPDLAQRLGSVVLHLLLSCPAPHLLRVQNSTGPSHHGPHGLPTSGSPHLGDPTSAPS